MITPRTITASLARAAFGARVSRAFAVLKRPTDRLEFPPRPLPSPADGGRSYDVNGDGKPDFFLLPDFAGRLRILGFDDDGDGAPEHRVDLSAAAAAPGIPHAIILLDSLPFQLVADRAGRGGQGWSWFDPPRRVIPPFPTMSGVIFSRLLGAGPAPGMINQYFDRTSQRPADSIFDRATGRRNAWELRLAYRLRYWENGLSFLDPRPWFRAELARAKAALDASTDPVTIVYLASSSGMVSAFGAAGVEECLDGLDQLCMSLLWSRRGRIRISSIADHGHRLAPGKLVDVPALLARAGFSPGRRLESARDVVVELDGLVNYAGIHTLDRVAVADALVRGPEIELVLHVEADSVIVRDSTGAAAVDCRADRYRYRPITHDVLGYAPVIQRMTSDGRTDAEGFAPAGAWLEATAEHRWPDAPARIWGGFHGAARCTPDVMITTRPGFYAGLASMQRFVTMQSTHGGLDHDDSATYLLTIAPGLSGGAMATGDVLRAIEPRFDASGVRA